MNLFSFRTLRVFILLVLFAFAALYTQGQMLRTTNWIEPLEVVIFPINGDQSEKTSRYISTLHHIDFRDIDDFMSKYAKHYQLHLRKPTRTRLGREIREIPPPPPRPQDSMISKALWSMKLRYWAWQNTPDDDSNYTRARVYIIYHQGKPEKALPHSLGLQKGLIGVVHAFAEEKQAGQNNMIIAHELLHTVGASDKYNSDGTPVFPDGFASPDRKPLYPQRKAEIMAGRIAIDPHRAAIPKSLSYVVVGEKTAKEIGWQE
ncbi:MAG: hypothetical protein KJO91_02825 [Gammaproteobacteria bacterium]|nr:hypothetical protein [Gammaproteobacteria bacterium]